MNESGAPRIDCLALFANSPFSTLFRTPMNCVFVHVSSTHEFGAMRNDCLEQFSILNPFPEPHELRFRSCNLHHRVWSHA